MSHTRSFESPVVSTSRIIPVGGPTPGHHWAQKLSTDHGERVARVVGLFADFPITLAPEVPNLVLEAAAAFIAVNPNPAGVAAVSVTGFMKTASALPDAIRKSVVNGFAMATVGAVIVPLHMTLRRALTDDCDADIAAALATDEDIASADVLMPDKGLAPLAERARATVRHAVAFQALLIARGRFDLADKVGEFTRLMRMGNVPLGITGDRTLIVLVA